MCRQDTKAVPTALTGALGSKTQITTAKFHDFPWLSRLVGTLYPAAPCFVERSFIGKMRKTHIKQFNIDRVTNEYVEIML